MKKSFLLQRKFVTALQLRVEKEQDIGDRTLVRSPEKTHDPATLMQTIVFILLKQKRH